MRSFWLFTVVIVSTFLKICLNGSFRRLSEFFRDFGYNLQVITQSTCCEFRYFGVILMSRFDMPWQILWSFFVLYKRLKLLYFLSFAFFNVKNWRIYWKKTKVILYLLLFYELMEQVGLHFLEVWYKRGSLHYANVFFYESKFSFQFKSLHWKFME
jgi:hypothetical protein